MAKNKLYLLTGALLIAGYSYLLWCINVMHQHNTATVCMFKNVTGLPCPSCGSTRSVIQLTKGHITTAAFINPLGIIIALLMVLLPLWLVYDLITKKDTFYKAYKKTEHVARVRWVAIIFITLITANWIWNIYKQI